MSNARNLADGESRFVNTAGDTMTGNLIVNANVGIGGAGPSTNKLHIESAGATRAVVYNSSNVVGVRIQAETGSGLIQTDTNHPLRFATNNGAVQMQIDTAGRVTKPYQPFFLGRPTNDYASGGMPTGDIAFTGIYNNGGCFNPSNSRFTAPVQGWYRTTWGGLQVHTTVTSLYRNGVNLENGNHFINGASYATMTQTTLVYLAVGDYLTIYGWNGGGYYSDWYLWSVELVG